jgi:hypothetical protein
MQGVDRQVFIKEYVRALREGAAALFVGAGISRPAGFVDWKTLLQEIAHDLGLDIDREADLVALAQFHVNSRQGRDRLNQLLVDEFVRDATLTDAHRLIAALPIQTVWTTNYDDLIETAFQSLGKRIDVKRRQSDFATTLRRADATLYKMHGDKTDPADAILTKEDYETYNTNREFFTIALKSDLARRTFLFLGVSFADPNIQYILGRVKQLLDNNGRQHYCLLKAPDADGTPECDYQLKRFTHWLADLRRYNIQPVLLDDYRQVGDMLEELNRRSHLRDVFVAGSAADFQPLGQDRFHELCRALGERLIERDFNIVSGFGLGVGDMVIVGAMQRLKRNDDDRLQLWPFPQTVPAGTDRATMWRNYRERMISQAGACIVLAGNKLVDGKVVAADGVRQEVEVARAQRKPVIPIGATGHVARELWTDCCGDPASFNLPTDAATAKHLESLGKEDAGAADLAGAAIEVLRTLEQ